MSLIFQNIDPPPPFTARRVRVCTPRLWCGAGGGPTRRVERGVVGGGSIFWKTRDTALYSAYVRTLCLLLISRFALPKIINFFEYFYGGLECVGHSFAYVAHFVFSRDVWIGTQRAAVASRRATN
jgi:hypothetical protein